MFSGLDKRIYDSAVNFTRVYKENINEHKSIREAKCLAEQYPALFWDIKEDDVFAGRLGRTFSGYLVGIHTQGYGTGPLPGVLQQCGYCFNMDTYRRLRDSADETEKAVLDDLYEYWKNECSGQLFLDKRAKSPEMEQYRLQARILAEKGMPVGGGFVSPAERNDMRFAGQFLNFDKLLQNGICGLEDMLRDKKGVFYEAGLMALQVLRNSILYYKEEAEKMNLKEMAGALSNIAYNKPQTLREAIQLMWIYSLMCSASCYSRMDEYLGDFYVNDLKNGILTKQEAEDLIYALFCLIRDTVNESDGRIILAGLGRRNPENADEAALAIIECQRRIHDLVPTTTLRMYKGMDERLFEKTLEVLETGCLYPTLYNDDVYVDGIAELFDVPVEEAYQYTPLGCGEMCLIGMMPASPNGTLYTLKALEHALYNGYDNVYKEQVSIQTGDNFETYEELEKAVKNQLDYGIKIAAYAHKIEVDTVGENISFLLSSMLFDDCIERGKGIFEGGSRYMGGCTEGFGFSNLADSLYAVKKTVYEDKLFTIDELKKMLMANFEGYDKERHMFMNLPKYGNDIDEVDQIVCDLKEFTNLRAKYWGSVVGLDAFVVSNVNPGAYTCGQVTGATPDGRLAGEYCAVGNSPAVGRDKNGIIAMLNSVSKVSPVNGGYITNIKLSREMFTKHGDTLRAVLKNFFANGGQQLNVTAVDKADLERALVEPEKYKNLIVRLGGWAARFVELDPKAQKEVMSRTQY